MPITDTDSCTRTLDEDSGINQPLGGALLEAIMHHISLICHRVRGIDQRELEILFRIYSWPRSRKMTRTLRTPKWKSPWPAAPTGVLRFGTTSVTTSSSASCCEYRTARVLLFQSTWIAKLCHMPGVNGFVNNTLSAWSRTLNECALATGNFPVGSVNGDPMLDSETCPNPPHKRNQSLT